MKIIVSCSPNQVLFLCGFRRSGDPGVRGVVQALAEAVAVQLVRQREAAEVPHPRGRRRRPLAVLRHQRDRLPLWAAQRLHVSHPD